MKAFVFSLALLSASASANPFMNEKGRIVRETKLKRWEDASDILEKRSRFPSVNSPQICDEETGSVIISGETFPCKNIDFESFVSLDNLMINDFTENGADIWGWTSPEGKEITLMGVNNGLWFIDSTNPADPQILGKLPGRSAKNRLWSDVKVYRDTAYFVRDSAGDVDGIQVFDLTRLVGKSGFAVSDFDAAPTFEPDFVYDLHGDSHNVIVDTDSGFIYSMGTNTCRGGLHIASLANPLQPEFVSCISQDGYTHDAQCVLYDGPDVRFFGKEICFAFNEDTLTLWDVSDKLKPILIARETYEDVGYSHQGGLSPDLKYLLLDDEADELFGWGSRGQEKQTRTMIVNIEDLENPTFEGFILHPDESCDHNLYFWGAMHARGWSGHPAMSNPPLQHFAYLSNYVAGVQVIRMTGSNSDLEIRRAGFFDIAPDLNRPEFLGTWSNFLHPSGVLAVSSIDRGLFFLRARMAFEDVEGDEIEVVPFTRHQIAQVPENLPQGNNENEALTKFVLGLTAFIATALVVGPMSVLFILRKNDQNKNPTL